MLNNINVVSVLLLVKFVASILFVTNYVFLNGHLVSNIKLDKCSAISPIQSPTRILLNSLERETNAPRNRCKLQFLVEHTHTFFSHTITQQQMHIHILTHSFALVQSFGTKVITTHTYTPRQTLPARSAACIAELYWFVTILHRR